MSANPPGETRAKECEDRQGSGVKPLLSGGDELSDCRPLPGLDLHSGAAQGWRLAHSRRDGDQRRHPHRHRC